MSAKEWSRRNVLERHRQRKLTTVEAAQILRVSARQVRRLATKYEPRTLKGIRHGNRGRSPSNKVTTEVVTKVLSLFATEFAGFNDTHFVECLKEVHGIELSRSTFQRIARAAGHKAARKRRSRKYHGRRLREGQPGKLLLWDGSTHDWLEGRGPKMCLMGAVDDATGDLLPGAHFVPQESAAAYLHVLKEVVREHGIPMGLYMDRHGSLKRNDGYWTLEEELKGEQTPTHVGQALRELGIEVIFALSPQAKGRVERLWGTLQDRLCSEMRRAGTTTLEGANQFLQTYRPRFNQRFKKKARDPGTAWRKLPPQLRLDDVCAFRYEAVVSNDNLVSIDGIKLQIPRPEGGRSYAQARVHLRQHLSGLWRVFYKDACIAEIQQQGVANEVRPRAKHKRNAATRAFMKAVKTFEEPREKKMTRTRSAKAIPAPYNYWSPQQKRRAAKNSKLLREQRPQSW